METEQRVERVEKQMFGFNFDKPLLDRFRSYCRDNQLNMSAVIGNLIKRFLEDNKKDVKVEEGVL